MTNWIKDLNCPACGRQNTIFVGAEGYLTCSYATCPNPDVAESLSLKAQREQDRLQTELQARCNALYEAGDLVRDSSVHYNRIFKRRLEVLDELDRLRAADKEQQNA